MPLEALRKRWDAHAAGAPLHCLMTFEGDDLVLGAGTKLAAAEDDPQPVRKGALSPNEARLLALLSAAYRRPMGESVLAYIRRALVKHSEGEKAIALTHLAMTGLPRLAQPEQDARRLFMADGLMKAGVGLRVILQALELDELPLDELERRYNPDQPRVPAGSGGQSGWWTRNGVSTNSETNPRSSRTTAHWQYAAGAESDAERLTEPERESQPVTFYNPETRAYIRFPANSALEPRAPPGFINLYDLPKGPTSASAPPGTESEVHDADPPETAPTAADRTRSRAAQLATNRAVGSKWEASVGVCTTEQGETVEPQPTLMSYKGNITRADYLARNSVTGALSVIEAKGSQTAPLTPRQRVALPEINEGGGTYIGIDRPNLPRGTRIPPQSVRIIRPPRSNP